MKASSGTMIGVAPQGYVALALDQRDLLIK